MRIRTGVYWPADAGCGRNQDSLSLQHVMLQKGECLLAAVCDGIGSLARSEEASGYAVHCMTDWFYHEGKELICGNSSKEHILLALQRRLCHMQEHLKEFQKTEQIQTGTTLSALFLSKGRYYLIHIGDSRIYRIRKRTIPIKRQLYHTRCLTTDDRTPEGCLLKCMGMAGADRAILQTGRITKGTVFLLCTDGFYYGNDAKRLGQVLGPLLTERRGRRTLSDPAEHQMDRRLELLGIEAQKAGSRDNMAAIAVCIY